MYEYEYLTGWSNDGETNLDRRFSLARNYGLGVTVCVCVWGGGGGGGGKEVGGGAVTPQWCQCWAYGSKSYIK